MLLIQVKGATRAATLVCVTETPPGDWFVVRGGLFAEPADLLIAVEDAIEDCYGPTASVHAGAPQEGEDYQSALERVCRLGKIKHRKIRVTTVARLLNAGFRVELDTSDDQPDCHHNVVFTEPLEISQAKLFVDAFDPPVPNPAKD